MELEVGRVAYSVGPLYADVFAVWSMCSRSDILLHFVPQNSCEQVVI